MSVPESQSLAAYRLPQRLLIAIGALTAMLAASSDVARGQGPQSNHGSIRAVPVPRAVTIDGQLDEWDLTAEIHSYGVRRLRDRYSVRVAAMWDAEALYLGLRWRDPTPMINNVDVDAAPGDGWMADSFQGRFIVSGRQVHLTTCYSSKKDKAAAVLEYDAALNPNGRRTFVTQGMETRDPSGFQQAFRKDSDARGYVQELRIPWPLLGVGFQPRSGEKIGFTGEYFWGNASGTTWPAVMWSDPINPKNPVRIVIYQNPGVWGEMELLGQGNLPPATTTDDDPRLQGPLPLRFEIPADAAYFSVVINDERGRRIRNLASHQRVSDYAASSAPGVATRIIEIPWDGRPDGEWNSERSLFLGDTLVAPGTYVARCIVHRGVGVTFAGSFYNPGTPPWATADGTGAWGFDHANPQAVGTIPRDSPAKGRVFLGWSSGEGGVGFIGLDASGRKIWEWLRRGAGATHIAATRDFVYFTFAGEGFRLGRVNPDSGEQVPFSGGVLDVPLPEEPAGLAARGETIAVALPRKGVVQIRDTRTGELRTEHPVDTPGSLAIMSNGEVVGVQGNKGLFTITAGGSAQLLVAPGSPLAVAADSAGRLYVSDRESLQVRVLPGIPHNVTGQLTAIGEPGGHVPGPWNPRRMGTPSSIAIEERTDGASRLWVTENQLSPRRVSVWDVASRALHRDYLGNTRYSASGGFLSDDLPGIGFVDGVSYRLDYVAGTYEPLEILGGSPRPVAGQVNVFTLGKGAGNFGNPNHFVSNASGQSREYIVEAGGTHPMIFMKRGERWQCVAALGSAAHPLPPGLPPPPSSTSVFSWQDANGDGHQQSDEIVWHDLGKPRVFQCGWGYRCGRDLTFYHSGIAFRPVSFTEEGAPIYDVRRAERLPGELGNVHGDIHRTRFGFVADLPSGVDVDKHNVIHGLHHIAGFNDRGELIWKYPNYWLAVHGAFTAPMAMPGVLMGVLKVTGIFEPTADSGHSIISLRGNIGQEFLLRDDGMYLGELFTDQRMAPADLPATREIVGAPINETTLGGEPFNGWMGRQRDGKVRMTYGFTDVRVAEVTGLDQIVDIPAQSITVGERELAVMRDFQPRRVAARVTVAGIPRGPAFTDEEIQSASTYADSPTTLIVRSGREEVGRVTLRWDDQSLHLACQVADATPFVNKGIDAPLAFKTGDSVNLFIADRGEVQAGKMSGTRVLLCKLSGKPTTVSYRPNGPPGSTFVFESPVRKSPFAHVGPIDDATFRVVPGMGGYAIGASVPWARLGVSPAAGKEMRGDIGLLFGDDTGAHTAQRVHWVDRETNVVNDVPTEAEFFPERWGTWKLLDPGETLTDVHSNGTSAEPVMDRPTKRDAGWRVVYSQDFDNLPVGLKTTEGALANWEGGSALGIVRDGGEGSTSGRERRRCPSPQSSRRDLLSSR